MSTSSPQPPNKQPANLSMGDRRLSALSVEERETDMPIQGDMSQVSTLTYNSNPSDSNRRLEDPASRKEDMLGRSTPTNDERPNTIEHITTPRQNDGQVMQFKKEVETKWSVYPRKGYRTTTKFFYEEIDSHWTAALIIVCFFVSGIVDSVSYQTFGVFTSLQTGNTILIALRLSDQPAGRDPFAYIKSITSVAAYCLGGLFFNILHRVPTVLSDPKVRLHRWTLFLAFLVQSALLVISAALAQSGWVSTRSSVAGTFSSGGSHDPAGDENYLDLLPIAFLAFEAAGQVCLSRVLIVSDLSTIAISTLYHDFVADALCWRQLWKNRKSTWDFVEGQKRQIRRILSILALFAGAIVGGFVYASPGGIAAALWIAAGTKVIICLLWCLWKRKVVTEIVVTEEPDTTRQT